jgi:ABC-2 type transport system ATP-binding protein
MESSFLIATDIRRTFRQGFWLKQKPVLRDISLTIPQGQAVGLIGPNGAGKTTLLKVLAGIDTPQAGNIRITSPVPGQDVTIVGFVPETPYFPGHFTVSQYLVFLCSVSGHIREEKKAAIRSVLKDFDLIDLKEKKIRTLSKGQRQRLNIAQALLDNPDFLILDEPLSGLDPRWRERMRRMILTWRERGKTIIFSSHILEDVQMVSDRILLMQEGRIVWEGTLSDIDAIEGYNVLAQSVSSDFLNYLSREGIGIQKGTDSIFFVWPKERDLGPILNAVADNSIRLSQLSARLKTIG